MTEETIFTAALEIAAPDDRSAFLDQACSDNPGLRLRIEKLLAQHAMAGSFLGKPVVSVSPPGSEGDPACQLTAEPPAAFGDGRFVGPYKLVSVIGEGGMGTVWLAQQQAPVKRQVALKVIKAGMDSHSVLARFEAERQALALMDHPNIAKVLDGGATVDGRPYFVMELVKGVPITQFCDVRKLLPRARLELFVAVCQAVQHAHQKGIIHRDLKPSNVLVALHDGRPIPKVIDFGVAKATGQPLTEKTLVTGLGVVVGTPEYMSPEQAELNQLDVDTRSDVYSLGVLLYELLTGTTPLQQKRVKEAALLEVLRLVREEEPPRPSTRLSATDELPSIAACRGVDPRQLAGLIRGELDWIVMKALEKDRARRYETANGFAADVQRYLAGDAVHAVPPSASYRLRKFVRQNRGRLVAATGVGVLLLAGGAFAWNAERQAAQRRVEAVQRERDETARLVRNTEAVAALLDQCEAALRANRADRAAFDLEAAERRAVEGGANDLTERLSRCRADVQLLRALDAVDTFRWTKWTEGSGVPAGKVFIPLFREALTAFGLTPDQDSPGLVAGRLARSNIRDRALTALDLWLCVAEPSSWVRAVLQVADPDPYRDAVRDAWLARRTDAIIELVEKPESLVQPARFAAVLGRIEFTPRVQARAILESALWSEPGHLTTLIELYGTYEDDTREDAHERVRWAQAAVAAHPKSVVAHNCLGTVLRDCGQLDDALARFRETVRLEAGFVKGHFNIGVVLRDQQQWDAAAAAFRSAIALEPSYAAAFSELGYVLANMGDNAGARRAIRDAIAIDPADPEPHFMGGLSLNILHDEDGTIAAYRTAIQLAPTHYRATNNLGVTLLRRGNATPADLAAAASAFRSCAVLDPSDPLPVYNLGLTQFKQGDRDGAIASFQRAIEIDEKFAEPYLSLGTLLVERDDYHGAAAVYRRAVRANPDYLDAHILLGALLCDNQRDYEGAVYHFREAIRIAPSNAAAHYNLGNALRGLGNLSAAALAYRESLARQPAQIDVLFNLGDTLLELGDSEEAVAMLRKSAEMAPADVQVRNTLGVALKAHGEPDECIAEFQAVLAIDANQVHALNNLAWVLATGPDQLRDGKKAVEHATRACELSEWKDPVHMNTLAAAYAEEGNFHEAVNWQKEALNFPEYALVAGQEAQKRLQLYESKQPYYEPPVSRKGVPSSSDAMR